MELETLVDRYGSTLLRAALAILGDPYEAEDAVQDAFLRWLEKRPAFRDEGHQRAWLLTVTANGCKSRLRARKRHPTQELLDACRRYYAETSRRISFEYAMIDGVNDSVEDARELIGRLKGLPAHFNLIPLNHVEESPLKPSSKAAVALFQKTLEDAGIPATVRRTLGGDIDASCGQLRRKYTQCKQERKI